MVAAIEQNMPQREIAEAAYRYQQEVEADERIVVGVNRYRTEGDEEIHILRIDPDLERRQIERLQAFKARRDSAAVESRIAELAEASSRARPQPDARPRRRRHATASRSARSATPGARSGAPGASSLCSSSQGGFRRSGIRRSIPACGEGRSLKPAASRPGGPRVRLMAGSRASIAAEPGYDLELEAVVGELDAVRRGELRRAVRQEQAPRAGGRVRVERLLGAQVAARLPVGLARLERRLADEQVGVPGELGDPLARAGVARVRERRLAVRDPEAVRLEAVVREPDGQHVEPRGRRERRLGVVLGRRRTSARTCPGTRAGSRAPRGRRGRRGRPRAPGGRRRGRGGRSCPRPTARGRPSGRDGSA